MKYNFLFFVAFVVILTTQTSCEKNTQVVANYDNIVLSIGSSTQVEISNNASVNHNLTQCGHESDSIFSISDYKKHSVVVTGNNVGKDTLRLFYNQGTHANGEFLSIPVSVEK